MSRKQFPHRQPPRKVDAAEFILSSYMPYFQPAFLAPFVAAIFTFILGTLFLLKDIRHVSYLLFFGLCFSIALWSFFLSLFNIWGPKDYFWSTLENASSPFIGLFFLLLFVNYPSRKNVIPVYIIILALFLPLLITVTTFLFPRLYVPDVVVVNNLASQTTGPLIGLLTFHFAAYFLLGFLFLYKTYNKSSGRLRAQIIAGMIGIGIAVLGALTTNLFILFLTPSTLLWFGPILTIIGTVSIAYMLLEAEDQEQFGRDV